MYINKYKNKSTPKKELVIKKANTKDIPDLILFQETVLSKLEDKTVWGAFANSEWEEIMNTTGEYYLAFNSDEIVAFALLNINEKDLKEYDLDGIDLSKVAIYDGIMVKQEYWGNNIQQQFSFEIAKKSKKRGMKYIVGTIAPDNKYSKNNMLAIGYKIINQKVIHNGIRDVYFKQIEEE